MVELSILARLVVDLGVGVLVYPRALDVHEDDLLIHNLHPVLVADPPHVVLNLPKVLLAQQAIVHTPLDLLDPPVEPRLEITPVPMVVLMFDLLLITTTITIITDVVDLGAVENNPHEIILKIAMKKLPSQWNFSGCYSLFLNSPG